MIKLPKFRTIPHYEAGPATDVKPQEKNIFLNNVRLLDDPKTNRKLILVGTYNASTVLSHRTKKILESAQPDKVLVETSPLWFQHLLQMDEKLLQTNRDVQSLTNFNLALHRFENIPRNLVFKAKFYTWLFAASRFFPYSDANTHLFKPGLEAFTVAKWAAQNGKDIVFSGDMFNDAVMEAFKNERRMFVIALLYRVFVGKNSLWQAEFLGNMKEVSVQGLESFVENMDQNRLEWTLKMYESIIPHQKKILVEDEDERLFTTIYRQLDGKVNLALVNAWHLPGIERHWRHTTGTQAPTQFINPIGDFDIDADMQEQAINDFLRRVKSKKARSEPTVTSNYLVNYNKQNTEAERERHVFFQGYDDPELEHGLYNDENVGVNDLPYKNDHH